MRRCGRASSAATLLPVAWASGPCRRRQFGATAAGRRAGEGVEPLQRVGGSAGEQEVQRFGQPGRPAGSEPAVQMPPNRNTDRHPSLGQQHDRRQATEGGADGVARGVEADREAPPRAWTNSLAITLLDARIPPMPTPVSERHRPSWTAVLARRGGEHAHREARHSRIMAAARWCRPTAPAAASRRPCRAGPRTAASRARTRTGQFLGDRLAGERHRQDVESVEHVEGHTDRPRKPLIPRHRRSVDALARSIHSCQPCSLDCQLDGRGVGRRCRWSGSRLRRERFWRRRTHILRDSVFCLS